jgi:hypothetical protein
MTAVDLVPGTRLPGLSAGEFQAQPRARRLAGRVLVIVCMTAGLAIAFAARHVASPLAEVALGVALLSLGIATMGYLVRRARLRVHTAGVRWGWDAFGFTMHKSELKAVNLYTDALALVPARGSTWYVSAADWDAWPELEAAFERAEMPLSRHAQKAPFQARMQSYGPVLNGLLLLDVVIAVFALMLAVIA